MTDELVETVEQKLTRYEAVIGLQMQEIDRLRAVVAKLTEGADDAHSTLRRLYLDETQPSTTRVRAAQAALNVEKPSLKPQPAPLELVAEVIEPLADVVARQRARCDRMEREAKQIRVLPSGQVLVLDERDGNDGDSSSNHS
jgi:uncharacterized coiled-coil protein SlyX